jgi:allophanate hydrolase
MEIGLETGQALDVRALRRAYLGGGLRPADVAETVLERIEARGDDAVWISQVDPSALLGRAEELGHRFPRTLPLFGIPFAVKDNIDAAGLTTTAGCPAFAYAPERDATAVRRLLDAGAMLVGKTNLDQFATGLAGTRSPYGACESVYGRDLVAGGSSSGSAVAVAAGLVPFALGTDTAGSGRVPAAMNGIVGLKPTRGLVSTAGVVPACRSLDCVSILSTSLDDAGDILGVLAGPDSADPWSRGVPAALPFEEQVTGLRLALPEPADLDFEGDDGMAEAFWRCADRAARVAREVVQIRLEPWLEAGDLLYRGPWVAERLAGLADFLDSNPDDVLPVIREVLEHGRAFDAVQAFRARHRLQELRAVCGRTWQRADVMLLPTVPTTFTRAEIAEQPVARNLVLGRFTQFGNLLDLAALAVPAGTTPDGRPAGVTLLGPAFTEGRLLDAARELSSLEAT